MNHKKGFTLVELLVVIAIIAILLSILMPSLRLAREQARLIIDKARQSQNGLANLMYADGNNGKTISCVRPTSSGLETGVGKDMTSIIVWKNSYRWLAKLFSAGILDRSRKSATIFYCPSIPKGNRRGADFIYSGLAPGAPGYGMTNLDRIMSENWPWDTNIETGVQVRNRWSNGVFPSPGYSEGRKKLESMPGKWGYDVASDSRKSFIADPWPGYHNGKGIAWFLDGHVENWIVKDMKKMGWYYGIGNTFSAYYNVWNELNTRPPYYFQEEILWNYGACFTWIDGG